MKTYRLFSILLMSCFMFLSFSASSQKAKVKVKKGQATVNKVPYCQINCKSFIPKDCEIRSLDGEIIASLVVHEFEVEGSPKIVYEIIFLNTDYKAQMEADFGISKRVIKRFYKYEVLKDGVLNEAGVKNFVKVYGRDLISEYRRKSGQAVDTDRGGQNDDAKYKTIERDRSDDISIFRDDIKQDFKVIATFSLTTNSEGGERKDVYSFFLPNGTLVATVSTKKFSKNGRCEMLTMKDNKIQHFNINVNSASTDSRAEEMAKYLVKRHLL